MKTIEEAERDLQEFLTNNPRAVAYQEEIDAIMSKTPLDKRLEVLTVMICCKFSEIQNNLIELKERC
jgi:hypothetical protein